MNREPHHKIPVQSLVPDIGDLYRVRFLVWIYLLRDGVGMKPNILDPSWKYIPAARTDIRKTIRREQKRLAELAASKVVPIGQRKFKEK